VLDLLLQPSIRKHSVNMLANRTDILLKQLRYLRLSIGTGEKYEILVYS